jgi:hypothetical protein
MKYCILTSNIIFTIVNSFVDVDEYKNEAVKTLYDELLFDLILNTIITSEIIRFKTKPNSLMFYDKLHNEILMEYDYVVNNLHFDLMKICGNNLNINSARTKQLENHVVRKINNSNIFEDKFVLRKNNSLLPDPFFISNGYYDYLKQLR